jgi:AAA+ superfamily predicted ATPase
MISEKKIDKIILREFEKSIIKRGLDFHGENSAIDWDKAKERIATYLEELGIYKESSESQLVKDIREACGEEYDALKPSISNTLPKDVDLILDEWIDEKSEEMKQLFCKCYYEGEEVEFSMHMVDGRGLRDDCYRLLKFNESFLSTRFKLRESDGSYYWEIVIHGSEGEKFFQKLEEKLITYMIAQKKGKSLNIDLSEITIKKHKLDDLTYPDETKKRIDSFIKCFNNWLLSPIINRWGGIFIGPPGTGKTTIGGLFATSRPEGCTAFYVPASSIYRSDQIEELFSWANRLAPSIIVIDDFDLISEDRHSTSDTGIVGTLMSKMDGLEEHGKIFTILNTNDPSDIERAIRDRPGRVFEKIVLDNFASCFVELLETHIKMYKINVHKNEMITAVKKFKETHDDFKSGFTPDAVKIICQKLHMEYMDGEVRESDLVSAFETMHNDFCTENSNESCL